MTRRSLPVYLESDQYEALAAAAKRSGRSMTDIMRQLIHDHLGSGHGAPPTDLSDLAGAVRTGRSVDVARDRDALLAEALTADRRAVR